MGKNQRTQQVGWIFGQSDGREQVMSPHYRIYKTNLGLFLIPFISGTVGGLSETTLD